MAGPLRRRDPIPLYVQVKDAIAARIRAGTYKVGSRLPREAELAEEFGVGAATVKQAVNSLAMEGSLSRRAGQGTFVAGLPPVGGTVPLRSFTETMAERGVATTTRLIERAVRPAGAMVAWHLDMAEDDPVVYESLLTLAAGEPVAWQESYVPAAFEDGGPQTEGERGRGLDEQGLYRFAEERYGLALLAADEVVWAEPATAEASRALGVAPGSPVLVAERTVEVTGHRRLVFIRTVYRAERFALKFRMVRGA